MSKQHTTVTTLRAMLKKMQAGSQEHAATTHAINTFDAADRLVNVKGRHHAEVAYRRLEQAVNGVPAPCS